MTNCETQIVAWRIPCVAQRSSEMQMPLFLISCTIALSSAHRNRGASIGPTVTGAVSLTCCSFAGCSVPVGQQTACHLCKYRVKRAVEVLDWRLHVLGPSDGTRPLRRNEDMYSEAILISFDQVQDSRTPAALEGNGQKVRLGLACGSLSCCKRLNTDL